MLRIGSALIGVMIILCFVVAPAAAQCYGDPYCYDDPPSDPAPNVEEASGPWEGFSDGRLNPDMAEYYSVWCLDGVVRILRGVPEPALVDDIPIVDVYDLPDGGTLTRESGLTVTRSGDTITLSGDNGNLAPQPGSKSFNREECLNRIDSQFLEQETAETQQQNLEYCATNFDSDNCPGDDPLLPAEVIVCLFQYLTRTEEHMTDKCRTDGLWITVGNAIGYIVAIVLNCGGGLLLGVAIGPGSLGFIRWRRRKQINSSTIQKEK